ncbi:hypothetical protein [Anatilimnocola floriformis]|uniref:hypothetical protein n=1 Tax=Anatilimnocola floriformis TaxID=2948575 RepID=UPI0020C4A6D0|nr:hypothetical protein [Anatilimnocola floriformis]
MNRAAFCLIALLLLADSAVSVGAEFASHAPTRPLPAASDRTRDEGPGKFVDAAKGDDAAAGTETAPWKTLQHAVRQLKPGDTLYLRGGRYYEHVIVELQGTAAQPITIRSYPNELATIDGGLREFFESPAMAWETVEGGAKGEYQSSKKYSGLTTRAETTNVLGHFGDSLLPLQGYRLLGDLRSENSFWNVDNKVGSESFVYCGPGLWFNRETERIHCRLAHTQLKGLGEDNYTGETDPRKLPLIVAAGWDHAPLTLKDCQHVNLLDLSLCGSVKGALEIEHCQAVQLNGVFAFGGNETIRVGETQGLQLRDCAVRGNAASWMFRGSLKYRALESRLFSANRWQPTGNDNRGIWFEHCEFTDSVDGIFLGNVETWVFQRNLVDNISDDGLFLTSGTAFDGSVVGGYSLVDQNRFSRILTTFAFGVGHGRQKVLPENKQQTGGAITIRNNVFDFRRPVHYRWPNGPDDKQELDSYGRFASDHGSPTWEPIEVENNTIIAGDPPRYDYLTDGLGRAVTGGTKRRVVNNIVCQLRGVVGSTLPDVGANYEASHNLAWSLTDGDKLAAAFEKYRKSPAFAKTSWTTGDLYADPQFVSFSADWREIADVRLRADSPAAESGWMMHLHAAPQEKGAKDFMAGKPYRGALPPNEAAWPVGVRGRFNVVGETLAVKDWLPISAPKTSSAAKPEGVDKQPRVKLALVIQGYPAFDAPLLEYALRKQGTRVTGIEKTWVSPAEFKKYDLIAFDGSLTRAKITPAAFSQDDLKIIEAYVREGGVLLLMRDRLDLFAAPEAKAWLGEQMRLVKNAKATEYEVLQPKHPWVAHLDSEVAPALLTATNNVPLSAEAGERLIGSGQTQSLLHRQTIGKGAIIYVGLSPAAALPSGRAKETVEREAEYESQYKILAAISKEPLAQ